jgi:fucose permease
VDDSIATKTADRRSNPAPLVIHAAFVLTGVVTTLLGPMLPVLSARWLLNDAQAGSLFTAQFTGSMLGVAISGIRIEARGYRAALVTGLGAMATGVTVLAYANRTLGILAIFGYGIGLGLVIPASNLIITELNPHRRAAALNWLNFSWGIGAAVCPFLVKALAASGRTEFFLLGIASALSLFAVVLVVPIVALPDVPQVELEFKTISSAWRNPFAFLLGSLFFLYVGTENCIGGWVASYVQRMQTAPGTFWALTPSFFWGALLAGRALAPRILLYLGATEMARISLMIAFCGVTALLAAHTIGSLIMAVTVTGLGLASVFPITISLLPLRFGGMAPRIGGVMFALAGLGGATLPWLVGSVSIKFGSLKTGLFVPWLGCVAMLGLYALVGHSPIEVSKP